jgi:RHS repeat-associated protein
VSSQGAEGGSPVSLRGGSEATDEAISISYYHSDHLGSSNVISDANGVRIAAYEYQPYGKVSKLWGEDVTDYKFTGKELDSTGLYYYGARYYDPEIGRFTQADTIVPKPFNPQSFNRYSYCLNNPIRYIDPSGHMPEPVEQIIEFVSNIIDNIKSVIDKICNTIGSIIDNIFGGRDSPEVNTTSYASPPPLSYAFAGTSAADANQVSPSPTMNSNSKAKNISGGFFFSELSDVYEENSVRGLKDDLINALKRRDVSDIIDITKALAVEANANITVTATGSLTGSLGPGYLVQVSADASGNVDADIGLGLGLGPGGFAVTVGGSCGETGDVSVNVTAAGGTGSIGGEVSGSAGFDGFSGNVGGGLGVGGGVSVTITGNINVKDLIRRLERR